MPSLKWKDFIRSHPFEVEDAWWFPRRIRSLMTDYLRILFEFSGVYDKAVPQLKDAIVRSGVFQILDLCSGSGGPIADLAERVGMETGRALQVVLSDKYPPSPRPRLPAGVAYLESPVDAARVPRDLEGFRTLFTSFHHFPERAARSILNDAVEQGRGIAVFEVTHATLWHFLLVLGTPLYVAALTPLALPFSVSRLFWTFIVPAVPIFALWDGVVSNFRSYSLQEWRELVTSFPSYDWNIGCCRGLVPVYYLIGCPR